MRMSQFLHIQTPYQLDVFVNPTAQFKTTVLQLFIDRPFDADYSQFALLGHVLKRGNRDYPDSLALARYCDQLYGASFGVATHRLGERHVLELQLELVDEVLLPDRPDLLSAGLRLLAGVLLCPLIVDGGFSEAHLWQEQEAQVRAIQSLYNDKAEYAHQRCLQEMFRGDPFARLSLGDATEVAAITATGLHRFYQRVLQEAGFQLFVSGNVQPQRLLEQVAEAFSQPLGQPLSACSPTALPVARAPQEHAERQPVAQGKLVMAYRSGVPRRDPLFMALTVYNGLLGGFGHSKLFQHVREQASLAYDCGSELIASKGVLLVEAGIAVEDLAAARAIIEQQLAAMRAGDWTDEEWSKTLLALQQSLRGLRDRPTRLALTHLDRRLQGAESSDEAVQAAIAAVTPEQVRAVAQRLELDTVFWLQGDGEEEEDAEC